MGEKIKILSKGKILNEEFEVELNHPLSKGTSQQIHLQSQKFRVELDRKDYLKYGLSVLAAAKKIKMLKRIK
ncbi:MAG: hypothetical protein K9M01_03170 [Candidatus Omnitrophica bacterium]|nr:hypothetical protein [Candidatus Omnitrophota bacterium]